MGRKKKRDELIFCYYCDRLFKDEATLVQHQKAAHFKCPECHRKLNTSQGLATHCWQVHKVSLKTVPKAIAGRDSMEIEIFGMAGVPDGLKPGAQPVTSNDPDDDDDEQQSKKGRQDTPGADQNGAHMPGPPPAGPYMPPPYPMHHHMGYPPRGPPMGPPPGAFYPPPYPGAPPPYPGGPPPPYGPPGMAPPRPGPPPSHAYPPPHMGPPPPHLHAPPPGAPQGSRPAAPGGPLFPVAPGAPPGTAPPPGGAGATPPAAAPGQPAPLFPVPGGGATAPANSSHVQPLPLPKPSETGLLWTDEEYSIEEHRARMPRYQQLLATQ